MSASQPAINFPANVNARQDVTRLLQALSRGEREAIHALLPVVYGELRRRAGGLMRAERQDHTLQPTALVHEVFMHLVGLERVDWKSRAHFFAVASQLMRRILVDHARSRRAAKRSGGQTRIPLGPDLSFSIARDLDVLAVDETLRRLAVLNPRHAEIVSMRFFGGLSVGEVAVVLDTPKRTLEAEWTLIKAWIRRELAAE
jgi:RNA polymerase sigma factor (TIGR02999 family)